ncbi:MAG: 16S rRNA (guanine(527)-N(7))-methyltransferase RsmG, partial [Clostridia bacterium]
MKKGFAFLGMEWTGEIQEKFEAYRGLILEWNKKFNLTAILDEQEMAVKHFVDSLTIYPQLNRNGFLADVGSGAGFPGIPLKIAGYPGEMCLMDSLSKRVGFLDEAIRVLNLAGTR